MTGMIAIVDALGAANYGEEHIAKFLESREKVLTLFTQKIEEMPDRIKRKDIEVFTFNDTILIAYNVNAEECAPRQIRTFFLILRKFFLDSLSQGLLFRGAVAIGTFYMDKESKTVMGQAVTDAAAWYCVGSAGIGQLFSSTKRMGRWVDVGMMHGSVAFVKSDS
jgi:hypothetical protein